MVVHNGSSRNYVVANAAMELSPRKMHVTIHNITTHTKYKDILCKDRFKFQATRTALDHCSHDLGY